MKRKIYNVCMALFCAVILLGLAQCWRSSKPKVWVEGWQSAVPMNLPRTGAKAVAVNDHIYVIGGGEGMPGPEAVHRTVEYAHIRKGGILEEWKMTTLMNTPRIFLGAVENNGVIYALGGEYFPEGKMLLLNSVEWTRVGRNGELGPWHEASPMLTPRRSPAVAIVGGYLYALGGYNGTFLQTVERTRIMPDGSLGPWKWVPQRLSSARYIHGGAAMGNRIYMIGGHIQATGRGAGGSEWTTVHPNGKLDPWKPTSSMNQSRFLAGSAASDEFLFVVSGYDGGYLSSVELARPLPDGNLGPWIETTPLPTPREGSAVAIHKNKIYVLGGSSGGMFLRAGNWAWIGPDGRLGYWIEPG